ncbi:MAG TPA: DUF2794 domain-containing protein [Lichenihabitans sp.]|jgi:hypothetical protein|nr:DUF2794 domain-containing protein [Lichenihabitans sp.]
MSDGEMPDAQRNPLGAGLRQGAVTDFPRRSSAMGEGVVSFDRHELREIFGLYGRRVAEGEWRDYAIAFTSAKAVFSIYRRASEVPLFRVEKDPSLARRQGAYAIVAATGLILKRGPDLRRVLQVLEKKPKLVVV